MKKVCLLSVLLVLTISCQDISAPSPYQYSFDDLDKIDYIKGHEATAVSFKNELSQLMERYDNTSFRFSDLDGDVSSIVEKYQDGELWGSFYLTQYNGSTQKKERRSHTLQVNHDIYYKPIIGCQVSQNSAEYSSGTYTYHWSISITTGLDISGIKEIGFKIGDKLWYWTSIAKNYIYSNSMKTTTQQNPCTLGIIVYYSDGTQTQVGTYNRTMKYPFTKSNYQVASVTAGSNCIVGSEPSWPQPFE